MEIKLNLAQATRKQLEILLKGSFDLVHEATNRGDRVAADAWAKVSASVKDRLVSMKYAKAA